MTRDQAIKLILDELDRAEKKFPSWPVDPVHAVAIVAEESGELVKAALDYSYSDGGLKGMEREAVQVGAMAVRFLFHLDDYICQPYPGGCCE